MPSVRSVSIGLWLDVGSTSETDELAGASHLVEHLLFKGTVRRTAQDIANQLDAVGGEINAYTGRESTCFYARVLDADLELAVDVLSDMFQNAVLRERDVESERRVVLEEIAMSADVPEEAVHDTFVERFWPNSALGRPVIGTTDTVGAMSRDDLYAYYRSTYTTDRLVVSAAGNVDHDALAAMLVDRLQPTTSEVERTGPLAPAYGGPHAAYDPRQTEQVHLVWGLESLSRTDPDRYALSILNAAFGGGISSRLFQEIREERGLAYAIQSGYQPFAGTGAFSVGAGTQTRDAATVLDIVRSEAVAMAGGDLSDDEVERAKGQVKGGLVLSMDDPGGRMSRIGRSELLYGEVLTVDELLARIDAVTRSDVDRVAKRIFGGGGAVLASVGPVAEASLDAYVQPLPT